MFLSYDSGSHEYTTLYTLHWEKLSNVSGFIMAIILLVPVAGNKSNSFNDEWTRGVNRNINIQIQSELNLTLFQNF